MKPSEVLIKAKALIQDEEHWCQGYSAKNINQLPTTIYQTNAYSFCSLGSIDKALNDAYNAEDILYQTVICLQKEAVNYLSLVVLLNQNSDDWSEDVVANYNDTHTHQEVLDLFDTAIALAQADEAV